MIMLSIQSYCKLSGGNISDSSNSLVVNSKCDPDVEDPESQESSPGPHSMFSEGTCRRSVKVSRSARLYSSLNPDLQSEDLMTRGSELMYKLCLLSGSRSGVIMSGRGLNGIDCSECLGVGVECRWIEAISPDWIFGDRASGSDSLDCGGDSGES